MFDHVARKGYDKVITHAQPKYARLWRMILGFKNAEGKKPVYFDGHEEPYIELVKELTPPPNAISETHGCGCPVPDRGILGCAIGVRDRRGVMASAEIFNDAIRTRHSRRASSWTFSEPI